MTVVSNTSPLLNLALIERLHALREDVFHACAVLRPSAEGEYQLSEAVGLLVRAGYEVATVRVSERVNVNTPTDVERAAKLVDWQQTTSHDLRS
jgi:glucose-1-phosphate thymidylyltransferase